MSASPPPPPLPVRGLAVFPLPLVLFPESHRPLHIFEPRYRRMLADCLDRDREFGIVCREEQPDRQAVGRGAVGTVAHVESVAGLPDGRSNIVVRRVSRFEVGAIVDASAPYLMAEVRMVEDDAEGPEAAEALLGGATAAVEVRATTHVRARSNGHGPSTP